MNQTSGSDRGAHSKGGSTCPFCGTQGATPSDVDSWRCSACEREYPTLAFKCREPDCWGFAGLDEFCEKHQSRPSP